MGTIVCQVCEGTIGHFEDEKRQYFMENVVQIVTVLVETMRKLNHI